jgi:hypothetical protein
LRSVAVSIETSLARAVSEWPLAFVTDFLGSVSGFFVILSPDFLRTEVDEENEENIETGEAYETGQA